MSSGRNSSSLGGLRRRRSQAESNRHHCFKAELGERDLHNSVVSYFKILTNLLATVVILICIPKSSGTPSPRKLQPLSLSIGWICLSFILFVVVRVLL